MNEDRLLPVAVIHYVSPNAQVMGMGAMRVARLVTEIDHTAIYCCQSQDITHHATYGAQTIPWEWVQSAYWQDTLGPVERPEVPVPGAPDGEEL